MLQKVKQFWTNILSDGSIDVTAILQVKSQAGTQNMLPHLCALEHESWADPTRAVIRLTLNTMKDGRKDVTRPHRTRRIVRIF
jgi:hypothetical protein